MINRDPEGYRKLLAYQKACELQIFTNDFAANLPKTKTFFDLADQMGRSGRSGSKNIVEGWKRNTTKEYFDFLGFSIGAVEELKDDAADIATGVYPNLMGLRGKMGVMGERGEMGHPSSPYSHSTLLVPLKPISRAELDQIKFYPLDPNLPPVIQLFLRAKELNFLLHKLQQSLDVKMDNDRTKPINQLIRENWAKEKKDEKAILKQFGIKFDKNGLVIYDNKNKGKPE
jgi:hypothetical protein